MGYFEDWNLSLTQKSGKKCRFAKVSRCFPLSQFFRLRSDVLLFQMTAGHGLHQPAILVKHEGRDSFNVQRIKQP